MPPRDFPVDRDEDGSRLETFLRKQLGLPRPTALKALRKGWVRVDGKRAKGNRRLVAGETVRITNYALPIPALDEEAQEAVPVPPREVAKARASLLHQDEELIVSHKPYGVVVHKGSGHTWGWVDALQRALDDPKPPTPIGRLDRDTSGLLALARGRGAARELFAQLKDGRLARRYQALVMGGPPRDRGRIDAPLAKGGEAGDEQVLIDPQGKPAVTRWQVERRLPGATLLRVDIETGRTHQIRAHLASQGMPILGDPRYGTRSSRALSSKLALMRLALHADVLRLEHPAGETLELSAPLPSDLADAVERAARD
jgi:23S rRNA pseudouridine955/2504/2580 synthase